MADNLETPSPPAPSCAPQASRTSERARARLGPVKFDETPGVFIGTGEAALADRLANAWEALAQEMEEAAMSGQRPGT